MLLAANPFLASYASSDLFGKLIFLSLFLLSILSWVVILYKILLTARARRQSFAFQRAHHHQQHPLTWGVEALSENSVNCFAKIYHRIKEQTVEILNRKHQGGNTGVTVELSKADLHLVENHAQSAITRAGAMLESQLFLLSTTVSLAPFLGLLGTVWGILLTFSELQNHVEGSSNQAMMSGLSMALATTVLGLLVAIPALIGYNFLRHSIRDFTVEMEAFATDILSAIEMQYRTE